MDIRDSSAPQTPTLVTDWGQMMVEGMKVRSAHVFLACLPNIDSRLAAPASHHSNLVVAHERLLTLQKLVIWSSLCSRLELES